MFMRPSRIGFFFLLATLWAVAPSFSKAQQPTPQPAPKDSAPPSVRLRVFLDCNFCDFDFMRTEINFVDYVRDRQDAQVHILVTNQPTGGGGTEFTLHFIGQKELAHVADTLTYVSPPSASQDDLRRGLARIIRLGLVRYYAHLGQAGRFDVTYTAPTGDSASKAAARDRWNLWVFRMNASGYGNGEKSSNFVSLNGSVNASRTTEMWKTSLTSYGNYNQSRFILSDGSKFNSYSHGYGFSDLIVKSLGQRWSAGQRASWTSSTYLNQKRAIRFSPAVEYNFFPYSQSTRRVLTLQYSPGINFFRYQDTTIFDKISEVRGDQTLTASIDVKQTWGSISSSLEGAAYVDDFTKKHLVFFNALDLRLFKGFSFFSFGQLSLLRDQLYLPRGNLSDQERLLRRRQLETSYSYFVQLGFSYSFGSIFNNIVNPRFGGTSGGFTIFN
ncbi:MAG TPA: hypothetical protein VGQ98_05815 [Gemmatimonadaceae bacterium]|nr:hypothetical protein [Gemmatimonadaceae bacterium]